VGPPPPSPKKDTKFNAPAFLYQQRRFLQSQHHFATDEAGRLYHYQNGCYHPKGEDFVERWLYNSAFRGDNAVHWRPGYASEVCTAIKLGSPTLWTKPPDDEINVLNGILKWDGTKWELHPHNPLHWMSHIQLPIFYDPTATCPAWKAHAKALLPDEDPDLLFKIAAFGLTPGGNAGQFAIIFLGEQGGEGKSVTLTMLAKLWGDDNIISRSPFDFQNNRFSTHYLRGKLIWMCFDMPVRPFVETDTFKQIITQDRVQAEIKGGAHYEFYPFCKVIMAGNRMPSAAEGGHGFARRWFPIMFYKSLPKSAHRPTHELAALYHSPQELSGALNEALRWHPVLLQQGLTTTPDYQTLINEMDIKFDPVDAWLDKVVEEVSFHEEGEVFKEGLYNEYKDWCITLQKVSPMSKEAFGKAIKKKFPLVRPGRSSSEGRPRSWVGIRRKNSVTKQSRKD
jgi:putative DNA primase/helicase